MALSQQHLANVQSTLLLARSKVSGPIKGLKLNLDTHPLPSHIPSPMLTAHPLIAPFSASHTPITPKLYLWLLDRSERQNLKFYANLPSHSSYASTL